VAAVVAVTTPQAPGSLMVRGVTVAAVVVVALIAAVVSYSHMHDVAHDAGEGWRSYLVPLSIDGLVVAASMVLLTRHRAGLPGGWLPWGALGAGVAASLAANMADANPTVIARLIAAWPAAAFAVAFELLLLQRHADQVPLADLAMPEPAVNPTKEPLPAVTYHRVEPVRPTWTPPQQAEAGSVDAEPVEVAVVAPEPDLEPPATANPQPPPSPDPDPDPLPDPTPSQVPDPERSPGPSDHDLVTRVRQVIEDSTAAGTRPPGRRALAKQLNASEHQVRVALELVGATTGPTLNGTSTAEHAGPQSGGQ
jgi:hypothetical protein